MEKIIHRLASAIGLIIGNAVVPFFYIKGQRFRKTIYNQRRHWGLMWWIFGGTVNYEPQIILKDGRKLGGVCKPPVWERIYNGSVYLVRKINPLPDVGNCESENPI